MGREALEAAGVRVVIVPGAGHNVMFDRPDTFAAAVAGRTERSATEQAVGPGTSGPL